MNLDILSGKITDADRSFIKQRCLIYSQLARQNIDKKWSSFLTNLTKNILPDGVYFWVTINWDPKLFELDIAKKILAEILSHKLIVNYWYNYEQRGKTPCENGKGVHNHLLIYHKPVKGENPIPPSYIKRIFVRKCKSYIGNPRHIDCRKTLYPSDKLHYLEGSKQNPSKRNLVIQDNIFRKKNELEDIYTNYIPKNMKIEE